MKRLLAALLLTAAPAFALDLDAMTEAERTAFGEAVRAYLMENPQVLVEAINVMEERRVADQAQNDAVMVEQLSDALFADDGDWVGGNPEGSLTLVEFVDFRCSVCRQVHQHVFETVAQDGDIRLILKDFPILGQESELAARFAVAARQLAGPEAYRAVHDHLFAMRGPVTLETLKAAAEELDLDGDAILEAMNGEAVTTHLRKVAQLAETMGVAGTPTFVVDDQILRGMPQDGLGPVIGAIRANGTTAAGEG